MRDCRLRDSAGRRSDRASKEWERRISRKQITVVFAVFATVVLFAVKVADRNRVGNVAGGKLVGPVKLPPMAPSSAETLPEFRLPTYGEVGVSVAVEVTHRNREGIGAGGEIGRASEARRIDALYAVVGHVAGPATQVAITGIVMSADLSVPIILVVRAVHLPRGR
jgi:hypothetical protein